MHAESLSGCKRNNPYSFIIRRALLELTDNLRHLAVCPRAKDNLLLRRLDSLLKFKSTFSMHRNLLEHRLFLLFVTVVGNTELAIVYLCIFCWFSILKHIMLCVSYVLGSQVAVNSLFQFILCGGATLLTESVKPVVRRFLNAKLVSEQTAQHG